MGITFKAFYGAKDIKAFMWGKICVRVHFTVIVYERIVYIPSRKANNN